MRVPRFFCKSPFMEFVSRRVGIEAGRKAHPRLDWRNGRCEAFRAGRAKWKGEAEWVIGLPASGRVRERNGKIDF